MASEYVRREVVLPIERIGETGWLDLVQLRQFVDEADRLKIAGEPVRVWWTASEDDRPPRLEVVSEARPPL